MAETIQRLFINPPIGIARLGGSTTPQLAYRWVQSPDPHSDGKTAIEPDWSLEVQSDGTVEPMLPTSLPLRDGVLIRPVCPFFELWASIGEPGSNSKKWKDVPVTPGLLRQNGASLKDVAITIDAKNFKASRRTGNIELRFGTFPPLTVTADEFSPKEILAVSPAGVPAARRMIPAGQHIPLGSFQVIKSRPQPVPDSNFAWSELEDGMPRVNVEVIRFRFTPAQGHFYGPPSAARSHKTGDGDSFAPVDLSRAFLNENSPWTGANVQATAPDEPSDTYDGADLRTNGPNPSLGVVDDTCEARIEVSLRLPKSKAPLTAAASVFVSPPDFAPDRRPFLSLADEINDRGADNAKRNAQMSPKEREAWVQDLFERVCETLSLLNLDLQRSGKAIRLTGDRLAPAPIANDQTREPLHAMGGHDALRNQSFALPAVSKDIPLPLTQHAQIRHRMLADIDGLRNFVAQNQGRLEKLIRKSFEAENGESPVGNGGVGTTTMRMPPFMRNSNSGPLTLAAWQYDLLMTWVKAVESKPAKAALRRKPVKPVARRLSEGAARRRADVLDRIARVREKGASGDRT